MEGNILRFSRFYSFLIFFFSPKLNILAALMDGTFEWSRGITYIQQCDNPFNLTAVREPAMKWRILPAIVGWSLGGGVKAGFIVPWAGVVLFFLYCSRLLLAQTKSLDTALTGCLLIGTTGGLITCTNFVGINDAWYLLAICAASFTQKPVLLACICLLGPWIEERFIIAIPVIVATQLLTSDAWSLKRLTVCISPGLLVYALARSYYETTSSEATRGFLSGLPDLWKTSMHYVPAGLGMGYRAAWLIFPIGIAAASHGDKTKRTLAWVGGSISLATVTLLAADYTRSTSILLPFLLISIIAIDKTIKSNLRIPGPGILKLCLFANMVIPFFWMTYNKCWLVFPLPMELVRFVVH